MESKKAKLCGIGRDTGGDRTSHMEALPEFVPLGKDFTIFGVLETPAWRRPFSRLDVPDPVL